MSIRHLISEPITILTPSRNGRCWIRYSNGRQAEVEGTELHADGGRGEISKEFERLNAIWDWSTWLDPDRWHLQGTAESWDERCDFGDLDGPYG